MTEPLTAAEEAKFRESVRLLGDDGYSLQWSNHAAARLLATIDAIRADLDGDNPIYRPPSSETYCDACGHGKTHHGHYDGKRGEWVDDGKCFVWVDAPRTATGRKRGPSGCRCKGWANR